MLNLTFIIGSNMPKVFEFNDVISITSVDIIDLPRKLFSENFHRALTYQRSNKYKLSMICDVRAVLKVVMSYAVFFNS